MGDNGHKESPKKPGYICFPHIAAVFGRTEFFLLSDKKEII
jgi:hypothetical protein